jgi:hypothetical protein
LDLSGVSDRSARGVAALRFCGCFFNRFDGDLAIATGLSKPAVAERFGVSRESNPFKKQPQNRSAATPRADLCDNPATTPKISQRSQVFSHEPTTSNPSSQRPGMPREQQRICAV